VNVTNIRIGEVQDMSDPEAAIVYDGECPFCTRYVKLLRLREAIGPVALINAREGGPRVERLRNLGYNLDGGFVLEWEHRIYHGADAINRLALLSTRSNLFNKVNAFVFKSRTASRVLYPMLRTGRDLTLFLMGRSKLGSRHN
jgi:predicted DCC family thiol-disulfide oxidoreductase YuxK